MKKIELFILLAFVSMFNSCSLPSYYQIYDVQAEGLKSNTEGITFEDERCSIYYNLWDCSGNLSFVFQNKTDKDLVIDLSRSFYIKNGMAFDYYKDQTYTSVVSVSKSYTASLSNSYVKLAYTYPMWSPVLVNGKGSTSTGMSVLTTESVATRTSNCIVVPAMSAKVISGFKISDYLYKECGNKNFNYPSKSSESLTYTREDTPLIFSNRIAYLVDGTDDIFYVENKFWVSAITNYKDKSIIEKVEIENCDYPESLIKLYKEINKKESPASFYNIY